MIIHLYTICWNEAPLLPFFFRHYGRFCDRMIVYDNGSDDGSREIIRAQNRTELRTVDSGGRLTQKLLLDVKGHAWKESRGKADWVIACDVDEILYHRDLTGFLLAAWDRGISLPVPTGQQMVSDTFPDAATDGQIYQQVRSGFFDPMFSKRTIFRPDKIDEINYAPGCHVCEPTGEIKTLVDPALKLLHFKFLGLDYTAARYAALRARQTEDDRATGAGFQYGWTAEELACRFEDFRRIAQEIFPDTIP